MTPLVAETIHFLCKLTEKMHGIWHCISWLHYSLIAKTRNCNVWEGKGASMTSTTANTNLINFTTRHVILTLCVLRWVGLWEERQDTWPNHVYQAGSVHKFSPTEGTFFCRKDFKWGRGRSGLWAGFWVPPASRGVTGWWENKPRWRARPPRPIALLSKAHGCCFYFYFIDSLEMFLIVLWPQGACSKMILHFSNSVLGIAIKKKMPEDYPHFSLRSC